MMEGFKKGAQTGGLESHGKAMGFKKGGQVKQSPQFLQKTSKQDAKDTGNMPAKRDGDSQQEKEAGGRAKVRPGYQYGGVAKAAKKGVRAASKAHKTHSMPAKSQGEGKKPAGRGAKAVGKGGKTGMHKSGRITKKG